MSGLFLLLFCNFQKVNVNCVNEKSYPKPIFVVPEHFELLVVLLSAHVHPDADEPISGLTMEISIWKRSKQILLVKHFDRLDVFVDIFTPDRTRHFEPTPKYASYSLIS